MHRRITASSAFLLALASSPAAQTQASVPYEWKSVQMVGAGFVDGIVFHPKAKGVRYARTDMGGAYRWDARAKQWAPMLDWVPYRDLNWMGVESIAVDPTDAMRVYLACGTYTLPDVPTGAILRSSDGGKTFEATRVPIKFGGNENGRGNGERMTVDPNDPSRLYLGTRNNGLWRSTDRGVTWSQVTSFPWRSPARSPGIVVTLVDPKSRAIYVAASDNNQPNLFRSVDDGTTWAPVSGGPIGMAPTHMVQGKDGDVWITYGNSPGPSRMTKGALWKWVPETGTWTDVTPQAPTSESQFGYAAVSVQANKPKVAIVTSFGRPGGEQIFRTLNGGQTWKPIIGDRTTYRFDKAPYVARTGIHWLFDVEIDPTNPNHAIFTTGYGGHETFNLGEADRGRPVIWHAMAKGIEESVALALNSPTKGAHLISAIGDYGGFVHWNLDRPAPEGNFTNPHFGNTSDIASAPRNPRVVVRVGSASGSDRAAGNLGYSLDFGRTWSPAKSSPPGAREGKIAVSADGATWVWSLRNGNYVTNDYGTTWTPVQGLKRNGLKVVADAVNGKDFYAADLGSEVWFKSRAGARTFELMGLGTPPGSFLRGGNRGDGRGGQDQIYATPGREGDLWIASAFSLLHKDQDIWTITPGVRQIHAFGFGAPKPGTSYPAMYLVGTIRAQRGIFRSTDMGKTWVRINDNAHQWGLVLQITGDPKRYGRVYVGTHGRGTFYGDPK